MSRVVKIYRVSSYIGEAMLMAGLEGEGYTFLGGASPFASLPTDSGTRLPYDLAVCSDKKLKEVYPDTVQVGEQCL